MASILEKAYDASKKICRTIFLGKPNLFTTSDLNRQFKQMRVELDNIQIMTGVFSDFTTERISSGGDQTSEYAEIKCHCTYIICRGMKFTPSDFTSDRKYFDIDSQQNQYVILRAKKKLVTYALDATHEISGAKFSDGTSMAAANQEVYYDEKFVVVENFKDTEEGYENICLLGYWNPTENGGILYVDWCSNYIPLEDATKSLMLKSIPTEYSITRAIKALDNMHYTQCDTFKQCKNGNISMMYLIKKGTLVISCMGDITDVVVKNDTYEWFGATFEPADENYLINKFNDMGYGNSNNINLSSTLKGVVIPIGRLHISQVILDNPGERATTQYGDGVVCLHLTTSAGKVTGVRVTSYLTSLFSFDNATKLPIKGLVGDIVFGEANYARLYMESLFAVIPLH